MARCRRPGEGDEGAHLRVRVEDFVERARNRTRHQPLGKSGRQGWLRRNYHAERYPYPPSPPVSR